MNPLTKAARLLLIVLLASTKLSYAQNTLAPYTPKGTGYVGIVHPIATVKSSETQTNLQSAYVVGRPVGINIWETSATACSLEFVPYIRCMDNTSSMYNSLFYPH